MRAACLAIGLLWAPLAGAEVLYRVPWPEGLSFMFTQAPHGRITSHFTKATLYAVDIGMPEGVAVLAARAGVVEALESEQGDGADETLTYEGNFVRIRHDDGTAAIYAHLRHRSIVVAPGARVAAGQLLGYSGATGDVVEPHLHFAVTRMQTNSAGWREEVSVPVTFYVGAPPLAFAPRAAVRVTANYSSAAEAPRAPSETRLFPWTRPASGPNDEALAWRLLALLAACALAGLGWFWRFSRK
jgi:murein DD-endopeptidase MepM/ murein hydrolase activator NlpD